MESEIETDAETRAKSDQSITQETYPDAHKKQLKSHVLDSHSRGNSTVSDDGNISIGKGVTSYSYSDASSTSTDDTASGGVHSHQSFACTEIPFRPRVLANQASTTKKIPVSGRPDHEVSNVDCGCDTSSALPVDQETFFKESISKESDLKEISSNNRVYLNSPSKTEERQIDLEDVIASTYPDIPSPKTDNQTSFASNSDFVVDDKDDNATSSPVISLPNVLNTTQIQAESAEDNCNRNSVHSQCSSPHSFSSHIEEQHFDPSLEEPGVCDPYVQPSEDTFSHDIPATEATAYSPDTCPSPKGQSKVTGDDVHVSKSAGVSYSSKDELWVEEREKAYVNQDIEFGTAVVSDVYRNGDDGLFAIDNEKELEEIETESIRLETKAVNASASGHDGGDIIEGRDLANLEDDTELEDKQTESINSEAAAVSSAVSVPGCIEKYEGNSLRIIEDRDDGSVINESSTVQNTNESGVVKEGNQQSVPCNSASYDHSNIKLLDGSPVSFLDASEGVHDNNLDKPSANVKILEGESSIIEETDHNRLQKDVSPHVDSQEGNAVCCDQSNEQFLDNVSDSFVPTEAKTGCHNDNVTTLSASSKCIDQDLESRSLSQGDNTDKLESRSLDQVHMQSPFGSGEGSQLLPQEKEGQGKECDVEHTTAVVANCESTSQFSSESYSVLASGELHTLPLSDSNISPSDQVTYPLTPLLPGFSMLPQSTPVNLDEMPPLPPLPPMQWRMGKVSLTSRTENCQNSALDFPSIFPSTTNDESQRVGYPSIDESRNSMNSLVTLPDTENHKSQPAYEDLGQGMASSSQTLSTESSLHTENYDNSSEACAAEFFKHTVPQPTLEREQPQTAANSGRELFWPPSTSFLPLVDDERPTGIRPMKIQRPRSPLIDAVAAHDKSKLRKVSERAKPQIPKKEERDTLLQLRKVSERAKPEIAKEEERDSLLEQIRAKSFNLKPAVQTRPTIQGPTTNLRVAAILEKANAIRQALAGSDDDENDDSWSDS